MDSAVFDAFAAGYDASFTSTSLGRMLRRRVWVELARHVHAGDRVLELACGTGEDAVWLAQQGVHVTATDGSPEMLNVARRKAEEAGVGELLTFAVMDLGGTGEGWRVAGEERGEARGERRETGEERREARGERGEANDGQFAQSAIRNPQPAPLPFDGVLCDFGGINVVGEWRPLAARLAECVRPDGHVILVPMGPVCPWEILWHLAHFDIKTAARRLHPPTTALIGGKSIPIWYPSASRLASDFAPWFRPIHIESLGLWLPPSYLGRFVDRYPWLFSFLSRLEQGTARITRSWGDHYILVLRREAVSLG